MTGSEYRIVFQIEQRHPGEYDFTEVGFGSSTTWDSIEDALHDVDAIVQNQLWESPPDHPEDFERSTS
ncbi:hypothetical protein [Glycomyces sp. YM15]|uniref:hypothetical protein n=1 Tax=Glycomyces sp. YM15 TaxID=2800446 RepID=UPI0019644DB2|nr:hypothetical protein [Glycomyces sp. YM15]